MHLLVWVVALTCLVGVCLTSEAKPISHWFNLSLGLDHWLITKCLLQCVCGSFKPRPHRRTLLLSQQGFGKFDTADVVSTSKIGASVEPFLGGKMDPSELFLTRPAHTPPSIYHTPGEDGAQ